LNAEVIRDSVLASSGSLDRTLGGPDIDYAEGERIPRRSLYFRHAYEKQMQFLLIFDAASPNECYRRSSSIIPQQALALSNSQLALSEARKLAASLSERHTLDAAGDRGFVEAAFELILSRAPTPAEIDACRAFLERQGRLLSDSTQLTPFGASPAAVKASDNPHQRSRENLVHVLFNHNDFVTVR
jgi:hypothetical protein